MFLLSFILSVLTLANVNIHWLILLPMITLILSIFNGEAFKCLNYKEFEDYIKLIKFDEYTKYKDRGTLKEAINKFRLIVFIVVLTNVAAIIYYFNHFL